MTGDMTHATAHPFSILGIVRAGYRAVFKDHRGSFVKAAALPVLLSMALFFLGDWLAPNPEANPDIAAWLPSLVPMFLLELVPVILFAVAWYRVVILGDAAPNPRWTWGRRHWRFLLCGLLLLLSIYLFFMFGSGLAIAVIMGLDEAWRAADVDTMITSCLAIFAATALFASPIVFYWVARLSFVFPAAAIDRAYKIAESWRDTHGFGIKLAVAFALGYVPIYLLVLLVAAGDLLVPCSAPWLDENCLTPTGGLASWVSNLLMTVLQYLGYAIAFAIFAKAFVQLGTGRESSPA